MTHIPYSYIVIEGTIGAGKTSLATMLSQEFEWFTYIGAV
jgi:deoxyadenosine/deoxycytidine kinase